jgi:hypothetical protein
VSFDVALSDKRKYPMAEFKAFVESARRYIEITAGDRMIHMSVVRAVNGLREFLEGERKRIPGDILFEADRLECQLFAGYDPSFDGEEPPDL